MAFREFDSNQGVTLFHFSFQSEAGQRVPGLLLKRDSGAVRQPAVIALHGSLSEKESQIPLLYSLAEAGFVGIAIDARHHGKRNKSGSPGE